MAKKTSSKKKTTAKKTSAKKKTAAKKTTAKKTAAKKTAAKKKTKKTASKKKAGGKKKTATKSEMPVVSQSVAVGDRVRVGSLKGIFTVTDNSDPAMVTLEAPSGAVCKAGRRAITKIEVNSE